MPPTFSSHSVSEFSHLHREIQQTRTGQVSRLKVICHVSYASKYPGNLAVCGTVTSIVLKKAVKCCISPDISLSLDSLRLVPHSKTGPGPTGTIQSYKTTSRIKGFIVVQLTTHWLTPEINIFMHYNVITGNAKYIIHNKEMIMFGLSWFV